MPLVISSSNSTLIVARPQNDQQNFSLLHLMIQNKFYNVPQLFCPLARRSVETVLLALQLYACTQAPSNCFVIHAGISPNDCTTSKDLTPSLNCLQGSHPHDYMTSKGPGQSARITFQLQLLRGCFTACVQDTDKQTNTAMSYCCSYIDQSHICVRFAIKSWFETSFHASCCKDIFLIC